MIIEGRTGRLILRPQEDYVSGWLASEIWEITAEEWREWKGWKLLDMTD